MAITATQLLTDLRSVGMLPTATGLSDALLLRHADMEIASRFVPLMRRVNEEYMVRRTDVSSVNGRIRLPERAIAGALRLVQINSGQGWQTLPQLSVEASGISGNTPVGFCFDATGVVLLPLGTNGTVRLHYYVSPGELTTTAAMTGVLTSIEAYGPQSVSFFYSGSFNHSTYPQADIISVAGDGAPIIVNGLVSFPSPEFTIDGEVLGVPAVGDRICATGYSDVVPLPLGLYPALLNRTAARVLTALAYHEDAQRQAEMAEISINEAVAILSNRSLGNPKRPTGGMLGAIGANRILNWGA